MAMKRKIDELDQDADEGIPPFTKDPGVTDFVLIVQGQKFFVSKVILTVASPVFRKMFTSDFREKKLEEMELPGKEPESVSEFLKCIYPNIMKPLDRLTIHHVLPLLHEYDCRIQVKNCESFIKESVTNVETSRFCGGFVRTALQYLFLSEKYNFRLSLEACTEALTKANIGTKDLKPLLDVLSSELREKLLYERVKVLEDNICFKCSNKVNRY